MTQTKKRRWPGLLLFLLFLIGIAAALVLSVPARFVYDRYGARAQPLRLQGIEGTLWQGKAAMLSYAARPVGPVHWRLDPWTALRGSARGHLNVSGPEWKAESDFLLRGPRVELAAASAEFPASMLEPALDIPSLRLLGDIRVRMDDVVIEDGMVRLAIGQMIWDEVGVSGAAEARFGRIVIDFSPRADGSVEGRVRDDGGPLQARGMVELRGLAFNAEVLLHARPGHEHIREALMYVGERTLDGGSLLRVEGTINRIY